MDAFKSFDKSVRDDMVLIAIGGCLAVIVFAGGVALALFGNEAASAVLTGGMTAVSGVIGVIGGYIKGQTGGVKKED